MSRQRAQARAARADAAARQAQAARAEQARAAERRRRHERRSALWRRVRLWQHGAGFRRDKERWATLAILVLIGLLLTYLVTRSAAAVVLVALVAVLASPALVSLLVTRRSR